MQAETCREIRGVLRASTSQAAAEASPADVAGVHEPQDDRDRPGVDGFAFFRYAINALVANDTRPGRSTLWEAYYHKD